MKKFFGTILILLGAAGFCPTFLAAMYYTGFGDDTPYYSAVIFAGFALACVVLVIAGCLVYRTGGRGKGSDRFFGALLLLLGVVYVAASVIWMNGFYRYALSSRSTHNPTFFFYRSSWIFLSSAILAALGLVLTVLGTRRISRLAGCAPAKASGGQATGGQAKANTSPAPEATAAVCPSCGKRYPLTQVYCEECGALLEKK